MNLFKIDIYFGNTNSIIMQVQTQWNVNYLNFIHNFLSYESSNTVKNVWSKPIL